MRKPNIWLALVCLGLTTSSLSAQWTWSSASSMSVPRQRHSATLLGNGKVLVAGGAYDFWGEAVHQSCELYDPTTNTWSAAAGMNSARSSHTATLLPDGRVFVTGGYPGGTHLATNTCEIYDPATDTWSAAASMSVPRYRHLAVVLNADSILIIGGRRGNIDGGGTMDIWGPVSSCEIYRISDNTWHTAASMREERVECGAALLSDGRVLVAGGIHAKSDIGNWAQPATKKCEIYDPASDTWCWTDNLVSKRNFVKLVTLDDNTVLTVGGESDRSALASCQIFDPATENWVSTDDLNSPRIVAEVLKMSDGNVMTIGGWDYLWTSQTNTAEMYDVTGGTWGALAPMAAARGFHNATLLGTGDILVSGGTGTGGAALTSCELFHNNTDLFSIVSVGDNPDDEGNKARVYWTRHPNDKTGAADQVTSYSVYLQDNEIGEPLKGLAGQWSLVANVPAGGHKRYAQVVATHQNGTTKSSAPSSFVVIANAASGSFATGVAAGQSYDNRGPSKIGMLKATDGGDRISLEWSATSSQDAKGYTIFRGTEPDFAMTPAAQIGTTAGLSYTDMNVQSGATYYYRVRANDVYDNPGAPTAPVSTRSTPAGVPNVAPGAGFSIGRNFPQPFAASTVIPVSLDLPATVSVDVYDNLSRLVAQIPARNLSTGNHQLRLDAGSLGSGNYTAVVHVADHVTSLPLLIAR